MDSIWVESEIYERIPVIDFDIDHTQHSKSEDARDFSAQLVADGA